MAGCWFERELLIVMTKSKAPSRIRLLLEKTLLVVGLVGFGMWLGSSAVPTVTQSWDDWAFDRQVRGETASAAAYLTEKQQQTARVLAGWLGFSVPPESRTSSSPTEPAPAHRP